MAESKRSEIYYINLGGTVGNAGALRYAWRTPKGSYDGIASALGAVKAKDTDKGLIFGANAPKPVEVSITYQIDSNRTGNTIRFCEPDKVNGVTTGGALNGKQITVRGKKYQINNVRIAGQ
ncbi:hypothetical protein [Anabaena azotica]|uniref:hypothetical protein n=1 Tax=Anabaena azotica TaxID=197653 RepID=UPI0039A48FF3